MKKCLSMIVVLCLIVALAMATSCRKKDDSPEAREAEKAIRAQWEKMRKAVEDEDLEMFKSLFAKKPREEHADFEGYFNHGSTKSVLKPDYDIVSVEFNKDKTEATATFKCRKTRKFVKDDAAWYLKEL